MAHDNITSKQRDWVKPDQYCDLNARTVASRPMGNGKYRLIVDPQGKLSDQLVEDFQYVTLRVRVC